ncbi:UNVERIFIED_CONTAM: hypothetical protein FKN15_050622 [Acipenser sinensis]
MDQPQDSQPSAPLKPSVGKEGPAVAIHFEKAQNRIQKFTECHPGSLGIKACLGMEVLGSTFSGLKLFAHITELYEYSYYYCHYHFQNETDSVELDICEKSQMIKDYVYMDMLFALAVQVATGITIASYCCKAIQCCGAPRSVCYSCMANLVISMALLVKQAGQLSIASLRHQGHSTEGLSDRSAAQGGFQLQRRPQLCGDLLFTRVTKEGGLHPAPEPYWKRT